MKPSGSKSAIALGWCLWVRKWLDPDLDRNVSNEAIWKHIIGGSAGPPRILLGAFAGSRISCFCFFYFLSCPLWVGWGSSGAPRAPLGLAAQLLGPPRGSARALRALLGGFADPRISCFCFSFFLPCSMWVGWSPSGVTRAPLGLSTRPRGVTEKNK